MKKNIRYILSHIVLVVLIASSLLCISVSARSSDYLDAYGIVLTQKTGGRIVISVDVDALREMTMIGASRIYLYESSDGKNFSVVKTYDYEDYPSMMDSGRHFYKDVATYYGTPGYQYYAVGYCYAGDSTGYDEKSYTTGVKTAIK